MAERVDYVTVALTDGDVPLLWEVRQQLMARLEHVDSTGRTGLRSRRSERVGAGSS